MLLTCNEGPLWRYVRRKEERRRGERRGGEEERREEKRREERRRGEKRREEEKRRHEALPPTYVFTCMMMMMVFCDLFGVPLYSLVPVCVTPSGLRLPSSSLFFLRLPSYSFVFLCLPSSSLFFPRLPRCFCESVFRMSRTRY